ncbi:hypothetical protein RUND412_009656 [Rhizina undulata]
MSTTPKPPLAPPTPSAAPRPSRSSHRSTHSITKTKIQINVYDLLPPGRLSSVIWTLGVALLHSGVVINDREYAFGGHDRRGLTGVYWTKPKTEPPGGTWRCEILHGFTYASEDEIEKIIREASNEFLGPSYNLLTRNCNHFTSHLCQRLTGQPAPSYLNRAASIGVALPCVVPAGWIEPPECGEVDDEDEEARLTGNAARAGTDGRRRYSIGDDGVWEESSGGEYTSEDSEEEERRKKRREARKKVRGKGDAAGRDMPIPERKVVQMTVT